MPLKKGRISKEEHSFIETSVNKLTPKEIAKSLNRNPDSVGEYIKKHFDIGTSPQEKAQYDLRDRPYYYELKQQFDQDELELFDYYWGRIVGQFNNDVLPTEEMQILDVVKIEVMMNRCLKSQKDNVNAINRLEIEIQALLDLPDPEELDRVLNMERQVGALRAAQENLSKDFRDLQDKKGKMLKDMKATREQRIKRLEDARESFGSWVAHLAQNPDKLKAYGIQMEKMRLSMESEKERLGQYHKYEDGAVDRPFLNHETVVRED